MSSSYGSIKLMYSFQSAGFRPLEWQAARYRWCYLAYLNEWTKIYHVLIAEIGKLRFCLQWAFKHSPLSCVSLCVSWPSCFSLMFDFDVGMQVESLQYWWDCVFYSCSFGLCSGAFESKPKCINTSDCSNLLIQPVTLDCWLCITCRIQPSYFPNISSWACLALKFSLVKFSLKSMNYKLN